MIKTLKFPDWTTFLTGRRRKRHQPKGEISSEQSNYLLFYYCPIHTNALQECITIFKMPYSVDRIVTELQQLTTGVSIPNYFIQPSRSIRSSLAKESFLHFLCWTIAQNTGLKWCSSIILWLHYMTTWKSLNSLTLQTGLFQYIN